MSDRVLKKEVCSAKGTLASGKLPSKKYVVTLKEDGSLNFAKEKSQDEIEGVLYINANFKVGDVKKKSVSIENGDGSKEITLVLGTDEEAAQWQKVFATVIEKFNVKYFGGDLTVATGGLVELPELIAFAIKKVRTCMDVPGIFRVSPAKSEIDNLKKLFNNGARPDMADEDVHAVTGILKQYLRDLPDPLCTFALYEKFLEASGSPNHITALKAVVAQLPPINQLVLRVLSEFLYDVAQRESVNLMSFQNIAIVFGPTILRPKEETFETIGNSGVVCVAAGQLFEHSAKIFTDVKLTTLAASCLRPGANHSGQAVPPPTASPPAPLGLPLGPPPPAATQAPPAPLSVPPPLSAPPSLSPSSSPPTLAFPPPLANLPTAIPSTSTAPDTNLAGPPKFGLPPGGFAKLRPTPKGPPLPSPGGPPTASSTDSPSGMPRSQSAPKMGFALPKRPVSMTPGTVSAGDIAAGSPVSPRRSVDIPPAVLGLDDDKPAAERELSISRPTPPGRVPPKMPPGGLPGIKRPATPGSAPGSANGSPIRAPLPVPAGAPIPAPVPMSATPPPAELPAPTDLPTPIPTPTPLATVPPPIPSTPPPLAEPAPLPPASPLLERAAAPLESIAESSTDENEWLEAVSPEGRTYYHHKVTKEVTWERPASLGPAPAAKSSHKRSPSTDESGHRRTPSASVSVPPKDRKSDKRPERSPEGRLTALEDRMASIEVTQAEQKKILEQILAKLQNSQ